MPAVVCIRNYSEKLASIAECILTFFWRSMTPDPCKAHKRRNVPAVVCIRNYSEKLASIAESTTAHPNEMSANAYFMPRAM